MQNLIQQQALVTDVLDGSRLDQAAAELFSDYSRARLQSWIKQGDITVNGKSCRPRDKVSAGDEIHLKTILEVEQVWQPEAISLDIVYEDESLLVINKPAGLVVHPAAGHQAGTLLNGLLSHCKGLELLPRAGIVHRLDKDTTGLMVVAKTLQAHHSLVDQLQAREVSRHYEALIVGTMTGGGTINKPMGRHPQQRKKMAVVTHGGKEAITHYRLIKKYPDYTHIAVKLETGRTHQIRVHMASIKHPLVGDPVYGGRLKLPGGCSEEFRDTVRGFKRQALHARELALYHPETDELVSWEVDLPADMQALIKAFDNEYAN